jgi:hypothetical protein
MADHALEKPSSAVLESLFLEIMYPAEAKTKPAMMAVVEAEELILIGPS